MKKSAKKIIKNNKKPIIIGAICAGAAAIAVGLGKAFKSMKASAKAQHEVDKAEFAAVKAESRANFEENKFHHTLAKAKAQEERDAKIEQAQEREAKANARYEAAKKK